MSGAASRRLLLDATPTLVLVGVGLAQIFASSGGSGFQAPAGADAALLVAACAPLVVRRRRPVLALAATFVAMCVWITAYYNGPHQPPFEPFLAGVIACFALGFHGDRRQLRSGLAVLALVVAATAISLANGGAEVGNAVPVLVWWAGAVGLGRALHERQALVELLRDRSARLERDRDRDIADAALEERARIARELHDVIAHAVSLVVVQAGAERRLLAPEQTRTAETLQTIESAGREALGELRRLLGVLRAHGDERLAPQPGLDALPDLLDEGRRGGQTVGFAVSGQPVRLPAGLDLTAYRIIQEALTNARKHAPRARADVAMRWTPGQLEIEVADDGPGTGPANGNGTGHGLIGMRERAALYGGSLEAAPLATGGFRVRARLPIERGSAA